MFSPLGGKAKIVAECDAGVEPIGAILRREGLYSSHLADWRMRRGQGFEPKKTGRPPKDPGVRVHSRALYRSRAL